jgi:hypothetical protein
LIIGGEDLPTFAFAYPGFIPRLMASSRPVALTFAEL